MNASKRVDRFLFAAVVAGFCAFDAITTGMWFSLSFQRTLERPSVILATVSLIALTIVALWLWAFRTGHADRRPFAIAAFITAAVAIAYQAIGPSVGWWSGLAFAPPLPLQALVYGWQLTSLAALLLLAYRLLAAYRPGAALMAYGLVLLLLAPATVWGERISLQQGDYTFEKGYSPVWDALWFVALAVLPLLIYEALRRRRFFANRKDLELSEIKESSFRTRPRQRIGDGVSRSPAITLKRRLVILKPSLSLPATTLPQRPRALSERAISGCSLTD